MKEIISQFFIYSTLITGVISLILFIWYSIQKNSIQKKIDYLKKLEQDQLKLLNSGSEGEIRLLEKIKKIFESLNIDYLTNQSAGYKDAVMLYGNNTSHEIDLIVISSIGVFVFEAKDWQGLIKSNENSSLLTIIRKNEILERNDPSKLTLNKLHQLTSNLPTPVYSRSLTIFTNSKAEIDLTLPIYIKHINDLSEYFRNELIQAKKNNRKVLDIEEIKNIIFSRLDNDPRAKHFHMMRLTPSSNNKVGEYHKIDLQIYETKELIQLSQPFVKLLWKYSCFMLLVFISFFSFGTYYFTKSNPKEFNQIASNFENIDIKKNEIDNIKVGAYLTWRGITVGWWNDQIPLPEGVWKVVLREDGVINGPEPFNNEPLTTLILLNTDDVANLQMIKVSITPEFKSWNSAKISCEKSDITIINDRMNTTKDDSFQLCKEINAPENYSKTFESRPKFYTKFKQEQVPFLFERFKKSNPRLVTVGLKGGSRGNRQLNYLIAVSEKKNIADIDEWLNTNMKQIEKHYDGDEVYLTKLH